MITSKTRIAIVHDWLYTYAGAERVLDQFLKIWPNADIFTLFDFLPEDKRGFLLGKKPATTFIQRLPFARSKHRTYSPLFGFAIEQHDLSGYDIVVSLHYCAAKGVLVGPDQLHICYCCSPMRYAWDLQHQYLKESNIGFGPKSILARAMLHYLRIWDARSSDGVDEFLTLSKYVARRIQKAYRRSSEVVWAPVDVGNFTVGSEKTDFYVTASRMVPYKRMDLIVEAFSAMPDKKLVVIGEGPEFKKIRPLAGPNVELLGFADSAMLKSHLQKAKAFVFAAEEDFGIAPLEAQACGTPVLAFGRGGAMETIIGLDTEGSSGHFFHEQTKESLIQCVQEFEASADRISPEACRANALRFSPDLFRTRVSDFVQSKYEAFQVERLPR